jgi:hypothetical protein
VTTYLGGLTRFTFVKPVPWTRLKVETSTLTVLRPFRPPLVYPRGSCHVSCYRRASWLRLELRVFVNIRTETETLHFIPFRFRAIRRSLEQDHWTEE